MSIEERWLHAKVTQRTPRTKFGSIGDQMLGEVYAIWNNPRYVCVRWSNDWRSIERIEDLHLAGY